MTATERTFGGSESWLWRGAVRAAVLACCLAVAGGCGYFGSNDNELALIEEEPADKLYNEGLVLLNRGSFRAAATKFEEVDRTHPYSDWARRALLLNAYANFESGNYTESVGSAQRYLTLYPGSEDAAYAQYLIAESHYREIPDVARDQQASERAAVAFRELVERYSETEYAFAARERLVVSRDQLAGREMEVGRFYLGKRNYLAAVNRFRVVVTDYQTTRHVEEALLRLTEAYYALGVIPEAQTAAAVLGHNYPNSEWYRDAHRLLQRGGYEPQESQGSWISRVFRRPAA